MPTPPRTSVATVDGVRYAIPELWLAGFCRHGCPVAEAVACWHAQAQLARTAGA